MNQDKISIRPELPHVVVDDTMTQDEQFQNKTLRPIMKMQHELILAMTDMYIKKKKNVYHNLTSEKKSDYIKNNLLADRMIIHELRGLVIGMFTKEEIKYYLDNRSTLNKRIQNLFFERIKSGM